MAGHLRLPWWRIVGLLIGAYQDGPKRSDKTWRFFSKRNVSSIISLHLRSAPVSDRCWTNSELLRHSDFPTALEWRHMGLPHWVSNHRQFNFQLNNWFKLMTRKTSKPLITVPLWGIRQRRWPADSPHKCPVMRKAPLWHDVFMVFNCTMQSMHSQSPWIGPK